MRELSNEITRSNPAFIIFTLDISGSMSERISFGNKMMSKCEAMSQIVNLTITEIIDKCNCGENYNDYFNLVILGYDGSGVESLLAKYSQDHKEYVTINDLVYADIEPINYSNTVIIDNVEFPTFLPSKKYVSITTPFHTTPMYKALSEAYLIGNRWIGERGKNANPPIFINITDGEASDAGDEELLNLATKIKSISTSNGNALFANIHIGDSDRVPVLFPSTATFVENSKFGQLLYDMSSELSEEMSRRISSLANIEWSKGDRLRAVGYNTSMSQLFNVLQIGSLSLGD